MEILRVNGFLTRDNISLGVPVFYALTFTETIEMKIHK